MPMVLVFVNGKTLSGPTDISNPDDAVNPWEAAVADTSRAGGHGRFPHVSLNSDGQPHPVVNILTIFTLVIGLLSFVLGLVIRNVAGASGLGWAITSAATGLGAMLVGLYTQMISATREQRVLIVGGIIAGFVGFALGIAHGGFSG
jgi:hypothetical protein